MLGETQISFETKQVGNNRQLRDVISQDKP
jgi:hypothetical protein